MKMLFFEKIVESTAGTGRTNGGTSRIVGFTFNGRAGYKKRALVSDVFLCDASENRLGTFEFRAGIEVSAILTRTQIRTTLWTLAAPCDFDRVRYHRSTHCTAQQFLKSRHLHPPRHVPSRATRTSFLRRRFDYRRPRALRATGVLISALSVFSVRH